MGETHGRDLSVHIEAKLAAKYAEDSYRTLPVTVKESARNWMESGWQGYESREQLIDGAMAQFPDLVDADAWGIAQPFFTGDEAPNGWEGL